MPTSWPAFAIEFVCLIPAAAHSIEPEFRTARSFFGAGNTAHPGSSSYEQAFRTACGSRHRRRGRLGALFRGTFCGRRRAPDSARHQTEEHTSELQSLMRTSYAVFCLKKHK